MIVVAQREAKFYSIVSLLLCAQYNNFNTYYNDNVTLQYVLVDQKCVLYW